MSVSFLEKCLGCLQCLKILKFRTTYGSDLYVAYLSTEDRKFGICSHSMRFEEREIDFWYCTYDDHTSAHARICSLFPKLADSDITRPHLVTMEHFPPPIEYLTIEACIRFPMAILTT
jgi:hypothetical protein